MGIRWGFGGSRSSKVGADHIGGNGPQLRNRGASAGAAKQSEAIHPDAAIHVIAFQARQCSTDCGRP